MTTSSKTNNKMKTKKTIKKIKKLNLIDLTQKSFDIGVSHQIAKKVNEIIDYLNKKK